MQNKEYRTEPTSGEEFKKTHGGLTPEEEYWINRKGRRWRWDEWGSPVGLGLAWTLLIIPLGIFLWLIHLAGILR